MTRLTACAALLLALLLSLQGFAVAAACDALGAPVEHCAQHAAPAHHTHHECGACCCMAVAATPSLTLPGRAPGAGALPAPLLTDHPALLPERLDRPPRA